MHKQTLYALVNSSSSGAPKQVQYSFHEGGGLCISVEANHELVATLDMCHLNGDKLRSFGIKLIEASGALDNAGGFELLRNIFKHYEHVDNGGYSFELDNAGKLTLRSSFFSYIVSEIIVNRMSSNEIRELGSKLIAVASKQLKKED